MTTPTDLLTAFTPLMEPLPDGIRGWIGRLVNRATNGLRHLGHVAWAGSFEG
jgi:hypothetical protein